LFDGGVDAAGRDRLGAAGERFPDGRLLGRAAAGGRLPTRHRFAQLELEPVRAALHCTALRGGRRTGALGTIAFVLAHSAVTGAIVGVWNEREAAELAQGAELRLTPDEVAAIASAA